jgi:hypothetical protein
LKREALDAHMTDAILQQHGGNLKRLLNDDDAKQHFDVAKKM